MAGILGYAQPPAGVLGQPGWAPRGILGGAEDWTMAYAPPGVYPQTPEEAAQAQQQALTRLGSTWPAQAARAAWSGFTLPGDAVAGRVDPMSEEGFARVQDMAGMVTLGGLAAPAVQSGAGMGVRTLHRGGWRPGDADDAADYLSVDRGYGAPTLFAHESRDVAGEYGPVGALRVRDDNFLDATTPEGAKLWKEFEKGGDGLKAAKKAGYSGVIYPDPHDWDFDVDGAEVAIFDPGALLFAGDPAISNSMYRLPRHAAGYTDGEIY